MKRFVAMICAFVLAMSLAIPAMALEKSPRIEDITVKEGAGIPNDFVANQSNENIDQYDSILPNVNITSDARAKEINAMTIEKPGAYRFEVKPLKGVKPSDLGKYILVISDSVKEYYTNSVIAQFSLAEFAGTFDSETGSMSFSFPQYLFQNHNTIAFDLLQRVR